MNTNLNPDIVNQVAYLRTTRSFPEQMHDLCVELNKAYVDTAAAVNQRIIGIFPTNRPAITGEQWFFNSQKRQSLRQLYFFTGPILVSIPHGINFKSVFAFSRCFGQYYNSTLNQWYGLINGSNQIIPGQIGFFLDDTNIIFNIGAGAPVLTKGNIVLEWISNV